MTYSELQAAAASLPDRIMEATYAGDERALQQLEGERATIRARLLFAELAELQTELADERAELVEAKTAQLAAGAVANDLRAQLQDLQRRIEVHQRTVGIASNRVYSAKEDIRRIESRIAAIATEQAQFASAAAAPVQRNLVQRHIPGPVRWGQ